MTRRLSAVVTQPIAQFTEMVAGFLQILTRLVEVAGAIGTIVSFGIISPLTMTNKSINPLVSAIASYRAVLPAQETSAVIQCLLMPPLVTSTCNPNRRRLKRVILQLPIRM